MKDAKDVIPWKVTDISIRPYDGYWSFNPSIHFDGATWRCVLRCCDYAMPDGVTVRSKNARSVGQQTKNALVIFDPRTWQAVQVFKMRERDNLPRESCSHTGYEDMRLFRTDKGGLQGIAASLHLKRERTSGVAEGAAPRQPPEQVLLSFDDSYDIVAAHPIRGDGWSGTPQKNWVPFDHCAEPRFLYSINKGTLFGDRGALHGDEARAMLSTNASPIAVPAFVQGAAIDEAAVSAPVPEAVPAKADLKGQKNRAKHTSRKTMIRGGDVRLVRGGRVKLDTMTTRPTSRPSSRSSHSRTVRADDSTRLMGAGRILLPTYEGLRGGTQLVRVSDDAWLAIAHEMKFVSGKKYYWHTWYLVDARGKMVAASDAMKLASNGIEFAAGLAVDGDRVVVSFGVDDMECKIGETSLAAVMAILRPIGQR